MKAWVTHCPLDQTDLSGRATYAKAGVIKIGFHRRKLIGFGKFGTFLPPLLKIWNKPSSVSRSGPALGVYSQPFSSLSSKKDLLLVCYQTANKKEKIQYSLPSTCRHKKRGKLVPDAENLFTRAVDRQFSSAPFNNMNLLPFINADVLNF